MLPECPKCNQPAHGTLETLSGIARISETSEGKLIYTGETEVCWDEQKTVVNGHGHIFFACSCGHTWPDPTVKEIG